MSTHVYNAQAHAHNTITNKHNSLHSIIQNREMCEFVCNLIAYSTIIHSEYYITHHIPNTLKTLSILLIRIDWLTSYYYYNMLLS